MWATLRTLSDYALADNMHKSYSKAELKAMPQFVHSIIQAKRDEDEENLDPNQ